jgi:hypothetical protein
MFLILFLTMFFSMHMDYMESVTVYCEFHERGYTTAGAKNKFDLLDKEKITTQKLDTNACNDLKIIFQKSEKKKHHQRKFGVSNLFLLINFKGQTESHHCILGKGHNFYILTDLTDMQEYVITDVRDVEYIKLLVKKIISNGCNNKP